ncbi:MAG: histidinol-phosphatase HisJ family protein [Ruminococcaceae bacterium]|nr:histidinol-phosphatase HisJ family protein [Oscillospiraceae bacterium]
MTVNLHTHTPRCNHAEGSEREYIEAALAAGIKTLGFSDHSPMPFQTDHTSTFRMKLSEVDDYFSALVALREEYKDRIHLLIGVEAEYYPGVFPHLQALLKNYPLDYLIMGQHFLHDEEGYPGCGAKSIDPKWLGLYVDQVIEGLETGAFTYLAHPDLLHYIGCVSTYKKHYTRLCERCKELDIPLEINLLGLKEGRHYPNNHFWQIAGEVGNKVVIGVDAHQPYRFAEADVLAKALALVEKFHLNLTEDIPLRNPIVL